MTTTLREFSANLEAWNKVIFGNVFYQKKHNALWLEEVNQVLEGSTTKALPKLDSKLKEERKSILIQEEIIWLQKTRTVWLKSGDGNTKFFHTSTLNKRRQNKIEVLTNE